MKTIRFLFLIILFVSCEERNNSVSYYFDSNIGIDSNHGTSIESPFKTLKKFLSKQNKTLKKFCVGGWYQFLFLGL